MARFLVLFLLLASPCFAKKQAALYAVYLDGLCQYDKKGEYDKFLKQLNIPYKVMPAKRAEMQMLKDKTCIFPVDRKFFKKVYPLIQSKPIQIVHNVFFSTSKIYKSFDEVKNLRVGIRSEINFGPKVKMGMAQNKQVNSKTLEQNIKKLLLGRTDVVLEFLEDVELYLEKNPKIKEKLVYDRTAYVEQFEDAVTCVDTPENKLVIDKFNETLESNIKPTSN
tara:strand:- start:1397 stop:2062 length:666 start_codon:yes stop_codon:yes gene_type:complete